jgi:diaminopimelate epimerase
MDSIDAAPIVERGSEIRRHPALTDGANVNFLASSEGKWIVRTYERGVEGETLACGTGAVASAILLIAWGLAESPVILRTRSGRDLVVTIRHDGTRWIPSLRGDAELVFTGSLA